MPITHAAEKALRQAKKSVVKNRAMKEGIRKLMKDGRRAIEAAKLDEAKQFALKLAKMVDKAAQQHILKKNRASRVKSRFMQAINKATKK